MTLEEKKAIQTVLIEEVLQRQESDPTLLIDVLLAGDGVGFIRQILTGRAIIGRNLNAMAEHLLRAVDQQRVPIPTASEPGWQANGAAAEA